MRKADPLAGRHVGELILLERIGGGASGSVYRARQPALQRDVVVKLLHRRLRASPEAVERFGREAVLASRIDHPFAAHIYAHGTEPDGLVWIAMELVRGTTLAEQLATAGPIPLARFVPFFDRLCEVVHTVHAHGIVHRDLKPANVMVVSRAGRLTPKLLDLGVASLRAELGPGDEISPVAIAGTPAYLAPELWSHGAATPASDLYALGTLAYEALTGRLPFEACDRDELEHAHRTARIPSLGEPFAAALDDVLARALAKQPEDRPASALELAAALRDAALFQLDDQLLPQLDDQVTTDLIARAPQPIAEAIASLEAARSVDRALHAVGSIATTVVRYAGMLALASRAATLPDARSPELDALFAKLRRGALDDGEWLALIGEIARQLEAVPGAARVPELVAVFGPASSVPAALAVLAACAAPATTAGTADAMHARLQHALVELSACLRQLTFLGDYILVVPRAGRHEHWMGLRRPERPIAPASTVLADGRAALIDGYGRPVLSLWPLIEVAAPALGRDEELFLLEGRGRHGVRRAARPVPYEREDATLWAGLGGDLLGDLPRSCDGSAAESPYRGLAAFTSGDARVFFGRERETEAFVNRLRVDTLLTVAGPSGAGKTSFVQAGVLPALPAGWWAITARPGHAPIASLVARLAHEGIPIPGGSRAIERDAGALGAALVAAHRGVCALVIDQFEELFTQCRDPLEREPYCRALLAAAASGERVRVVLALRADFLVRAHEIPALRDHLVAGLHMLATPLAPDLLRIVREPVLASGYEFEDPALPGEMVDAVAGHPSALPLLSFVSDRLWALRDRQFHRLTRRAYDALGGVVGALASHAETTLGGLPPDDHRLVRQMFRHLVMADGTRSRMTRRELIEILDSPRAGAVIEHLIAARLLQANERGDLDEIEVVHEALAVVWPRLAAWRRDDAEIAGKRDGLRIAARQWDARSRPRSALLRDDELVEYRSWRARFPGSLTTSEERFVRASLREAARGQRIRRGVLASAFVAVGMVAAVLYSMRQTATSRLAMYYEEQGRQLVVAGDPARGLVYLAEAVEQGATSAALGFSISAAQRAMSNQQRVLAGHRAGLWDAQWSRDGEQIATASEDGTAWIWDAHTGRVLHELAGHTAVVRSVEFSSDGDRLVTAGDDRTARIWDVQSGALIATLTGHDDRVWRAAYSADGAHLMTYGSDNTLRIWDAHSFALRFVRRADTTLLWAALSADGRLIAQTVAGHGTSILETATGRVVVELASGGDTWVAAFSPDGSRIVTGGAGGTMRVWDVATARAIAQPAGHRATILAVAFTPDGTRVVSAGNDGLASVWDAATGAPIASVAAHGGGLHTIDVTPDGARLLTTSSDGVAQVWDVRSGVPVASFQGHLGLLRQGRFSPDGRRVVTASVDGTARIWEPREPSLIASFHAGDAELGGSSAAGAVMLAGVLPHGAMLVVTEQAASVWNLERARAMRTVARDGLVGARADGAVLAARDRAHRVVLADGTTGAVLRTLDGHTGVITHAAFGRGDLVATASRDRTVRLWASSSPSPLLATLEHPAAVHWVELSPDGSQLVTAAGDGHARVWDLHGQLIAISPFAGHSALNTARFDPSGSRVVTAGIDGTARIWDLSRGAYVATLRGHQNVLLHAAFSAGGGRVASSSFDRTVKLWDAATGKLLASLETGVVTALTYERDQLITGTLDGRIAVWDVSSTPGAVSSLAPWLRCHVPLALGGGGLIAAPLERCP